MNLLEGRVGLQESASTAWIACVIGGLLTVHTQDSFANGNASYVATLFAAVIGLGVFFLVASVMRARGCETLPALYCHAFGNGLGFALSLVTVLMILYEAMIPLSRILLVLSRFIFVESPPMSIAVFFVPVVVILAVMGLETITRTSRIFLVILVLAFVVMLVLASPNYKAYRLYPLLGGDLFNLARQSLSGTARYVPVLLALLACARGMHGVGSTGKIATVSILTAAVMVSLVQFCLGLTFSSEMLSELAAPIYRLTMSTSAGSLHSRVDKLLLFSWMICALLSGGFLCYAAALMYTRASGMRDTRPAAVAFSVLVCTLALLAEREAGWLLKTVDFLWRWAWLIAVAPPLLAAGLSLLKRRKPA